ncbi:hypothetical protein BYT27DRAFT_7221989 [Phlegmacium glaucopus]|nr:hypothetical protein BYT27DRAFT_7221989 [Phlegmacium glaucopus]
MPPRSHITRPRRSSPPTRLVAYLDEEDNWKCTKRVLLPRICCEKRLHKTRNSIQRSKDNNDLLEFIGDRVINLACSLMVDKIKISSEHHKAVGRALCNNDTIGRLAYQYGLHKEAIFNYHDDNEVKNWHPRHNLTPPKALADLFEAYVGALYEEHGWDTTMTWLTALYKPLVEVATEDFLQRNGDSARPLPESKSTEPLLAEVVVYQERLLDYLNFKGPNLVESGQAALDALPPATQFFFSLDGPNSLPILLIFGYAKYSCGCIPNFFRQHIKEPTL